MPATLDFGSEQIFTALRAFLLSVLPDGVAVVQSQQNKVPEPIEGDFVLMTPTLLPRLTTNVDDFADCQFTASMSSGGVMTVSAVQFGRLAVGRTVFGVGLAKNTLIKRFQSGDNGGIGTYLVAPGQTLSSQKMACGVESMRQSAKAIMQLDVHGPNSWDNAIKISTSFRDIYATSFFEELEEPWPITPLYADDPQQVPFVNENQQYENRYVIKAELQVDQTVTVPQQFADAITATLHEVQ